MATSDVTDDAVEEAARALWARDYPGQSWESGPLHWLLTYRDRARAALEAALPLLAPQPVVDREALARPDWRQLVWAEMSHRGYTDEQIKAAERQRCADTCEWDGNSLRWECFNEDGESNHPDADELAEVAGVIERVLDAPAVLALINASAK